MLPPSLCRLASERPELPGLIEDALHGVTADRELFLMVSAACKSWVTWKGRESNGILVTGTLIGMEHDSGRKVLLVETEDGKSGVVRVGVAAGERVPPRDSNVLIFGTISDETVIGTVLGNPTI